MNYKEYLTKVDDIFIYLVDGEEVRNTYTSDFTEGSNWLRARYIPSKEIWLEYKQSKLDLQMTLIHEVVEILYMLTGKNYDTAHFATTQLENWLRGNQEGSNVGSSEIGGE